MAYGCEDHPILLLSSFFYACTVLITCTCSYYLGDTVYLLHASKDAY